MLQSIPSFYAKISEKVSSFLQLHMKNTLLVKTSASPITTKRRVFYPFVSIILYYLELFKSYQRSWIHFVSPINTWTVCTHFSSIDSVEKLLQRVDKCLVTCNEQLTLKTRVDRMPSIAKKRLLRKKYKKHLFISFQKTKTTQTSCSVFAERNEKVKRTKLEFELKKIVDCFLVGYGSFDGNLVSFKIKSL